MCTGFGSFRGLAFALWHSRARPSKDTVRRCDAPGMGALSWVPAESLPCRGQLKARRYPRISVRPVVMGGGLGEFWSNVARVMRRPNPPPWHIAGPSSDSDKVRFPPLRQTAKR